MSRPAAARHFHVALSRLRRAAVAALLLVAALPGSPADAVEGKWTPTQVLQLDPSWLRQLGLELLPRELWNEQGAGLLEAAISIGGCSAGFVSQDGLVATNYHCAYGLLQQHSSPERDLIRVGFLARSGAEELAGEGTRALLPHTTRDVSREIAAAVPRPTGNQEADDLARFRAVEKKSKELVAACEKQPSRRCQVAAYDGGVRYELVEGIEFPDVRVVYAPPRGIGEYGGEVDNWSWPRHTGDFTLLRVWAAADGTPAPPGKGTVPYHPKHFFPVSPDGASPGDFVMLAGYPGRTFRAETAAEMQQRAERGFPARARLLADWIAILEKASAADEATRIALASRIKSLGNVEKNARGQVAGIARGRTLEAKDAEEREVLAWAASRPQHQAAVQARTDLAALVAKTDATFERDFLLSTVRQGPLTLDVALRLVRWAKERQKPDAERDPDYQERHRDRHEEAVRLAQKRLHVPTEIRLLGDWLARAAKLPAASRIAAVDHLLGAALLEHKESPEAMAEQFNLIRMAAATLHAGTKVADLEERTKMFAETPDQLRARRDPLLDFALALDEDLLALKRRDETKAGAVARLRPLWRKAVMEHAGKPIAPDANGTLRVSFGRVAGYSPQDGVLMTPQTTVAGAVQKHTGEEPFVASDFMLAAAPRSPQSRWADADLHDVPVDFLADADTTGGNSGSPVLDGNGRLVGLNFDRVWENVANDFGYNPAVARNISVDVRFLLWVLESEHGAAAAGLLREMGIPPGAAAQPGATSAAGR